MTFKTHNPAQPATRRRPAFTLLEMVVAIGAVALISVGLAAIFQAVGKTVSGGKRLSLVTNYAALLENRMRADFAAMTRRGPLVIRQQWVDVNRNGLIDAPTTAGGPSADDVELSATGVDTSTATNQKRPRRIDEIVFFAAGSFTSARESPLPGALVQSNEARIYYGQGMRQGNVAPAIDDRNDALGVNGQLGMGTVSDQNHFASNWTLVRSQLLLVNPETAPQPGAGQNITVQGINAASGRLANKRNQIALLPAASSAFRSIAAVYPNLLPGATYPGVPLPANPQKCFRDSQFNMNRHPLLASGVVDIATTSLDEIRATILGNCANSGGQPTVPSMLYALGSVPPLAFKVPYTNPTVPTAPPATPLSLDAMHAWMRDLFPTQSQQTGAYYTNNINDPPGVRIRTEDLAVGLDEVMYASAQAANAGNQTAIRQEQEQKTDREMMVSNNLLPRCTEFKVEWSFGDQDPTRTAGGPGGQVVWFGLRPAVAPGVNDITSPAPYPWTPSLVGTLKANHKIALTKLQNSPTYNVSERLIYGESHAASARPSCATSYFGFLDPTYQQPSPANGAPSAMPWAWPKMIRVTVSLADPIDPTYEATFQYIFEVPNDAQTQ